MSRLRRKEVQHVENKTQTNKTIILAVAMNGVYIIYKQHFVLYGLLHAVYNLRGYYY